MIKYMVLSLMGNTKGTSFKDYMSNMGTLKYWQDRWGGFEYTLLLKDYNKKT